MTTVGKSRVQVIHFLSYTKRSGSANSTVTGTTKKVLFVRGCPPTGNRAPRHTKFNLMSYKTYRGSNKKQEQTQHASRKRELISRSIFSFFLLWICCSDNGTGESNQIPS